jgi:hypothetical protein
MKKVLVAACLILTPLPAFSQSSAESDGDHGRRDRLEQLLREFDDHGSSASSRRGFGFLLRSGDSTIAVRCDPNESMKACVEATTTLLERARSLMPNQLPQKQ